MTNTVLRVDDLAKHFTVGARRGSDDVIRAVDGVSFALGQRETLGLVGESGCGKSTLAKLLVRLMEPTSGRILFGDDDLTALRGRALRRVRSQIQMVFQDPYASLNPRMTVEEIIAEPLRVHRRYRTTYDKSRVCELMELVGLRPDGRRRLPHEFSGGQRQRIGIARALALQPRVLILDEPLSALDVSVQAQIVNLLKRLQAELGLAYLLIAHDLAVVRHLSDRVAVMYLGRFVEVGGEQEIYDRCTHPYTQALLSAVPIEDPDQRAVRTRIPLRGDLPSPLNPPSGCRFRTRCWKAETRCSEVLPELTDGNAAGHPSACFLAAPQPRTNVDQNQRAMA
jgi:oligopeptide/dipeptide ABC transporter ATP-binding protein